MGSMRRARWVVIAALRLGAACAATGSGATKVSPGQELLYSGTVEQKIVPADGPEATLKQTLTASALVSEADPERGYQILLMQNLVREPSPGRKPLRVAVPPSAYVNILRDRSDVTGSPGPRFIAGPPFLAIEIASPSAAPRESLK